MHDLHFCTARTHTQRHTQPALLTCLADKTAEDRYFLLRHRAGGIPLSVHFCVCSASRPFQDDLHSLCCLLGKAAPPAPRTTLQAWSSPDTIGMRQTGSTCTTFEKSRRFSPSSFHSRDQLLPLRSYRSANISTTLTKKNTRRTPAPSVAGRQETPLSSSSI